MLPEPLHPAIVHFPIVLTFLAPFAAAGALWAHRRGMRPSRAWSAPVVALALLTLSAWTALATGEREEDRVERVVARGPLHSHEEAAEVFLYSSAGVLLLALVGFAPGVPGRMGRVLGAAGSLALVGIGWNVGRTGGELVYRHGAAQAYARPTGAPERPVREHEADDDEAMRHLEEARIHYALVVQLLQALHNDAAGREMIASTDHLAVVARSLGGAVDRDVADLASARATALQLASGPSAPPPGLAVGVEALRRALDALARPLPAQPPFSVPTEPGTRQQVAVR